MDFGSKIQFSSLSHYHMLFGLDVNGTKIGNGPSRNRINQFHFPKDEKRWSADGLKDQKGLKTRNRFEIRIFLNTFEFFRIENKTNRKSNNRIFRFYSKPNFTISILKPSIFRVEIVNFEWSRKSRYHTVIKNDILSYCESIKVDQIPWKPIKIPLKP